MQAQMAAPEVFLQFIAMPRVADLAVASLPQDTWIRRCALRLQQLRPNGEPELVTRMASDLWKHVARFNPEIAAEIEHESAD